MKKILSLLLALTLPLALLTGCGGASGGEAGQAPDTAAAREETPSEPAAEPEARPAALEKNADGLYEIYTAEDLAAYRDLLEAEMQESFDADSYSTGAASGAILMADIDMASVCGEDIGSWRPIGAQCVMNRERSELSNYPDGSLRESVFDGNGHTIYHLYSAEEYAAGLFYRLTGSELRDLTIADSVIVSESGDVGIVVRMESGAIKGVTVEDSVQVTGGRWTGGVVGRSEVWNWPVVLENCTNRAAISGGALMGGICGYACDDTRVIRCENYGDITVTETSGTRAVGGIVGYAQGGSSYSGVIIGCVNYGDVAGVSDDEYDFTEYGGIAGYNQSTICFCVNAGDIAGAANAWDIGSKDGSIRYCLNIGTVSALRYADVLMEEESSGGASVPADDPSLTDGTLAARLNELAGDEYWVQGEDFPVWSGLDQYRAYNGMRAVWPET